MRFLEKIQAKTAAEMSEFQEQVLIILNFFHIFSHLARPFFRLLPVSPLRLVGDSLLNCGHFMRFSRILLCGYKMEPKIFMAFFTKNEIFF